MCLGNLEGAKSKMMDEKRTERVLLVVSPLQRLLAAMIQSLHHSVADPGEDLRGSIDPPSSEAESGSLSTQDDIDDNLSKAEPFAWLNSLNKTANSRDTQKLVEVGHCAAKK